MSNIFEYMKSTAPETAFAANPRSTRNTIRAEAKEYAQFLASAQKTAGQLGFHDEAEKASDDFRFLCGWLLKFGLKDEE